MFSSALSAYRTKVLEDDRHSLPEQIRPEAAYVDTIPPDCATAGLVQASHHLGQRGLARAVQAHQGDHLTLVDLDAGGLEGKRTATGIGEAHRIGSDPMERLPVARSRATRLPRPGPG